MPLPLTVSCFTKIQIGFTFLVLAHPGSPGQRAIKRVCVCVCVVEANGPIFWPLGATAVSAMPSFVHMQFHENIECYTIVMAASLKTF